VRRSGLALVVLVACSRGEKVDDQPQAVTVLAAGAVVKHGAIGTAGAEESSYVLVDVRNDSKVDRLITVGGRLGAAHLGADVLRVPVGAVRTYALVADGPGERPSFQVEHAIAVDYAEAVTLDDRREKHGDLVVATATAKNGAERTASVVFACAFHDAAGALLARPFTVAELGPGATQTLRFEGPKDAARAEIFVGQVAFKP
jgi:hypothetical protein